MNDLPWNCCSSICPSLSPSLKRTWPCNVRTHNTSTINRNTANSRRMNTTNGVQASLCKHFRPARFLCPPPCGKSKGHNSERLIMGLSLCFPKTHTIACDKKDSFFRDSDAIFEASLKNESTRTVTPMKSVSLRASCILWLRRSSSAQSSSASALAAPACCRMASMASAMTQIPS